MSNFRYKKQLSIFLSNFCTTFWKITGKLLENLEQLVESPYWSHKNIQKVK